MICMLESQYWFLVLQDTLSTAGKRLSTEQGVQPDTASNKKSKNMGRRKSGTILALSQQNNNWDFFFLKGGGELGGRNCIIWFLDIESNICYTTTLTTKLQLQCYKDTTLRGILREQIDSCFFLPTSWNVYHCLCSPNSRAIVLLT